MVTRGLKFASVLSLFTLFCAGAISQSLRAESESAPPELKTFPRTTVPFKDEANLDPEFQKFRDEFIEAVKRKDLKFLLEHSDLDIYVNYDGTNGIKGLMETWGLITKPSESAIWKELDEILRLGGTFDVKDKTVFYAPYAYSVECPGFIEEYRCIIITEPNVRARAAPNSKAPVIDIVGLEMAEEIYTEPSKLVYERIGGEEYPWIKVRIYNGKIGYIYGKYLRKNYDLYAGFVKRNGVWVLASFMFMGD